ncbi:hypothetical protein [Acidiplasma aeolicum]|uniref:DUF1453 domain-containing protein n=1 Tax=Acidiplasma aeolicum TaxID=507754 RepID=A0A0Q0RR78_9ARCH|nr:hypothetical protein [Acidiplasma aeolicum]KQB34854.1 hypothetical protein AOG54_03590 [Acidiplasma aeolicum]
MNLSYLIIIIFVLFIAIRRMYSGLNGRKFRASRIFSLPLIYAILLLFSLEGIYSNLDYIILVLVLIFPGILFGLRLGDNIEFFYRNNRLYYKRSQAIMAFWLASFIARIFLFLLYPLNILAGFIIDLILAFTLGLIIGESLTLYSRYREFLNSNRDLNGGQ